MVRAVLACLSVFVALSAAAQGSGWSVPRFLIVDYHPVSKTAAPNSKLYDYVYRVDVRNSGATVAILLGRVASKRKTVTVLDAEAKFYGVEAAQVKASADTITVRAHKHFDRRLDKKVLRNGKLVFEEGGVDPDDHRVPGMPRAWDDLANLALDNLFLLKSFHNFEWTFEATVSSGPPAIANQLPAGLVNTAQPTITAATSDPDGDLDTAKTVLKIDGTDVTGQAQITATGVSYTPPSPLGQGAHTVTLTVGDAAINTTTATWSFTVDTAAPTVTSYLPRDTNVASPSSVIGAQYADATAGVSPASIVLRVDGVDVTALATVSALDLSFKPATALSQGTHIVALHLEDHAGNAFDHTWSFGVDSTGPTIANAQPKDVVRAADALPTISASLADGGAGVNVSSVVMEVDGTAVAAQASTTGVSFTPAQPLSEGVHTVKVRVADANNNASELVWGFTTRSLPTITQMAPKDVIVGAGTTLVISAQYADVGSGIDATKTVLNVDGVDFTAQATVTASGISFTPATALPQGLRIVQLTVMDLAGNAYSETWRFTLDTGAPVISDQAPKNTLIANQTPTITVAYQDTGLDGSGIDTSKVKLLVDGVDFTAGATVTASQVTYVPTAPLATGLHTMVLTVADLANNTTESTWSFVIDALSALITEQSPKDVTLAADALPTIMAKFADRGDAGVDVATVRIEVDGVDVTGKALVSAGQLTFTPEFALPEGGHSVMLSVADTLGNSTSTSWQFLTRSEPTIDLVSPRDVVVNGGGVVRLYASYADIGSGVDISRVALTVDGQNVTSQSTIGPFEIDYGAQGLPVGLHSITLSVFDRAGNQATRTWQFTVGQAPSITALTPTPGAVIQIPGSVTIGADFTGTSIDPGKVVFIIDGETVTGSAQVSSTGIRFTPSRALAAGPHVVYLSASASTGGATSEELWQFTAENNPTYSLSIATPAPGATLAVPRVEIAITGTASTSYLSSITVNSSALDADLQTTGQLVFKGVVQLQPGANDLAIVATYGDRHQETRVISVNYDAAPTLLITSPADFSTLGPINPTSPRDLSGNVERPVTIRGTVSRPVAGVTVNQQQAVVEGQSFVFDNFFLHEGTNLLTATATDLFGRTASASITLYVDQTAPLLSVESPSSGAVTSSAAIDVRGVVNDAVEGGVNAPNPTVKVRNGANDSVVVASVRNRFFVAREMTLEVGANSLVVTATDQAGNERSKAVQVTRILAGSERLTMQSGDRQRAPINSILAKPLAIVALDRNGNPLAGLPVTFDVVRGTGSISTQLGVPEIGQMPLRNIVMGTDSAGRVQVYFKLGRQAGQGANAVRVSHPLIAEHVVFTATGEAGPPAMILAEGGGMQYAEANAVPLEALSAVVYDNDRNPLPGLPVTFKVESGDASFAGAVATVVTTDKDGRAMARPLLGVTGGPIHISASTTTNPGDPMAAPDVIGADFAVVALPQSDGPTQFFGAIYDHQGTPLQGVRVSIARTSLAISTDSEGRFAFESSVPPGKIDLFVDGRTFVGSGSLQYPSLHFEVSAIRGQRNMLPHPIYLPPLNLGQSKIVGGSQDVTLTIPGFDGFEMVVKANSVTFPDGSRVGPLIVSPVNVDRMPMVLPGGVGAAAVPAWTIQPTGTRFDPPIQVSIPNNKDWRPGETLEVLQWDHDLATFVPMGRATVSEDGAVAVTDPGSGVTKAGWGGACTPVQPNKGCSDTKAPKITTLKVIAPDYTPDSEEPLLVIAGDNLTEQQGAQQVLELKMEADGCASEEIEWDLGNGKKIKAGRRLTLNQHFTEPGSFTVTPRVTCKRTSCGKTTTASSSANGRKVHVAKLTLEEAWSDQFSDAKVNGFSTKVDGPGKPLFTGARNQPYALMGVRDGNFGCVRVSYKLEGGSSVLGKAKERLRFAFLSGSSPQGDSGQDCQGGSPIRDEYAYVRIDSPPFEELRVAVGVDRDKDGKIASSEIAAQNSSWSFKMVSDSELQSAIGAYNAGVARFGPLGREWLEGFRDGVAPGDNKTVAAWPLPRNFPGLSHPVGAVFNSTSWSPSSTGASRMVTHSSSSRIVRAVLSAPAFKTYLLNGIIAARQEILAQRGASTSPFVAQVTLPAADKITLVLSGGAEAGDLYAAIGDAALPPLRISVTIVPQTFAAGTVWVVSEARILDGSVRDLFDFDLDVLLGRTSFAWVPILGPLAVAGAKIQASHMGGGKAGGLVFLNVYDLNGGRVILGAPL